jgi:hypothetical protein
MLIAGEVIEVPGLGRCRVELVNECRARVRPMGTEHRVIAGRDGVVEFDAPRRALDISPSGTGLRVVEPAARRQWRRSHEDG